MVTIIHVLQFSGTSQIDFLNVTSGSVDARLIDE